MSTPKFVTYCRVSTDEQGRSGLGVDAQVSACLAFVEAQGGEVVKQITEIASGASDNRPGFIEALKLAKRHGARVLVAKLDRLSRNADIICGLTRHSEGLICIVDCPTAGTLEIQLRAIIAEEERRKNRERTKAALGVLKSRGVLLGSARPDHWAGREDKRKLGQERAVAKAASKRRDARIDIIEAARPIVVEAQASGSSLRVIAGKLNAAGVTTSGGKSWRASQVQRLLKLVG